MKQFGQEPRNTFVKPDKMNHYEFEELLRNHKWTFIDQDNFSDYIKNHNEENRLFRIAMYNGPDFVRSFYYAQRYRVVRHSDERIEKLHKEQIEHYEKMIQTGDPEFDEYRKRLDYMDWYYDYSDDGGVARRGHERFQELKKIAEEKGGMYKTLWLKRIEFAFPENNTKKE